ncbi:hypothetical protein, variant [Sphaeroforma arctica JP610]|uniref:Thioredoxin domain-containing protein n=1 Tax=Sphaeroforma arctica JP610 TaxID=667725 RepID=A0A0L0G299_9EUKA|nr:hypothetical protein, variant [Sphaeroforma arctica JP610]KNC83195.1 hypothetical protein, variant [Sphaeroforma arctica JP610]|eukprot:XP_014157097.1 hypothetical protein, variant [Sphaeroforma arctica JP610]
MSDTHSSDERNPKKIKMTKGPIQVGATVPSVTFKCRVRDAELKAKGEENPFAWKDVTSEDLFKGKRSVIFCLPGAFTPTCSSTHVPGYEKKYEELKAAGIDEVYCFSVNDAFVMRQWGLKLGLTEDMETGNFKNVKLIPDGAALFTRGMGLNCVWEVERGFGERSWRYSALINDMKVEAINIEPGFVNSEETRDFGPDPFEVSDADTMLKTINALKEE